MRLWKEVPAYRGWIARFLFIFLAGALPAGAQQAAESNSTTQSVAGQQRIPLDGLPDSSGAPRSGLQKAAYQQSRLEMQSMPDDPAEWLYPNPQV